MLKARTMFCCWFCVEIVSLIVGVGLARIMIFISDGKVVMAYSSVAHMTLCVVWLRISAMFRGLTHVIVSPLIFVAVYLGYTNSRSRLLGESFKSNLLRILVL